MMSDVKPYRVVTDEKIEYFYRSDSALAYALLNQGRLEHLIADGSWSAFSTD